MHQPPMRCTAAPTHLTVKLTAHRTTGLGRGLQRRSPGALPQGLAGTRWCTIDHSGMVLPIQSTVVLVHSLCQGWP